MSTRIWSPRPACARFLARAQRPGAACALIVLLASGFALRAADRPDAPIVVEEIVAKINGDIVTRGDLDKARVSAEKELRQQGLVGLALQQQMDKVMPDELERQIDRLLLVQKAKELDIKVDDDLKQEIARDQSESRISDPDKFHDFIREQTGMAYEDFVQMRKNLLLTDRVIGEEVWRNIVIPDADIQKYYDAHKAEFVRQESVTLREIMVSTGDNKPETIAAAEKKANLLLTRARAGVDKFSDLARQYSDDASATDDGMLPPFEKGKLNKAIEDVVFKHDKGYVTDLIQIRGIGFEFFKVEDHTPAGQASVEDVKGQITNILTRPIAEPKLRAYLTVLRQNAFLQIKPGYIDTGAAPGKDTAWKDPTQLMPETVKKSEVANQRHLKKFLGIIPYGYAGEAPASAAAPPAETPVPQAPPTNNADGTPR